MYVERNFFNVKYGCMNELLKHLATVKWFDENKIPVRVYRPVFAPFDVLCMEFEYDSLAAYEELNKKWIESQDFADFIHKWVAYTERGGYSEAWELL